MPIHEIKDNRIMVENWSEGRCFGMREANDAEAFCALINMVKDLQDDVADLQSRLVIAGKGL